MNSIFQNLYRFLESVVQETSRFDETTWAIIAISTTVFGYFLLKGNAIR